jgi:hypothetical protein
LFEFKRDFSFRLRCTWRTLAWWYLPNLIYRTDEKKDVFLLDGYIFSGLYVFYVCSKLRVLNDLLDGTHFLAYIEAMSLGVRPGIHPSIVYGIISNAAGRSTLWEFIYSFVFCLNK